MDDSGHGADVITRSETLDRVSDAVVALDGSFEYTYLNARAEELLGEDAEDVLGRCVWDVFPEAAGTVAQESLETAMEAQREVTYERFNETLELWFEVRAYPDEDGLSLFFRDVTDKKERERELRETNRQLTAIVENSDQYIYFKDRDGRYRLLNEAAADLFGLGVDEAVGKTDDELFDTESAAAIERIDERILNGGETITRESVRYIDGERYVFLDNKYPFRNEDNDVVGVMGISRDITARKEHERRLELAETLFHNTQDALFLIDVGEDGDEFRLEHVNPAYEEVSGLTNEEIHGRTIRDVFGEADARAILSQYRDCVQRREPLQYEERLSVPEEGSYWETRIAPVVVDDRVVQLVGATRNVTDRKLRERRLKRTLQQMRALISGETDEEVASIAVGIARDVLSLPLAGVHLLSEDGSRLEATATTDAIIEELGEEPTYERASDAPIDRLVWDVFESGETLVADDIAADDRIPEDETPARSTILVPLGDHGVFITSAPNADAIDEIDRLLAEMVGTNLTAVLDRKRREQHVEEQRDNLELLTQMMSHDIRNDLQIVTAYSDILDDHVDEEGRAYLETVQSSAADAVELTQSVRDLVAAMLQTDGDLDVVPLRSTLESQLEEVRASYSSASITVDGSIPAVHVLADDLLPSVFRNVLKNAVQHNDKDVAEVCVGVETDPDWVRVRIADNGPGIPDDRKTDVFGRGEKGLESEGTGIGLYLVKTLVDQYGGNVWVEDRDDGTATSSGKARSGTGRTGAAFVVELARADD